MKKKVLSILRRWLIRLIKFFQKFDPPAPLTAEQTRQQKCALRGHRKGFVRPGIRIQGVVDSAVHMHTFVDGSTKIWCGICNWTVWSKKGYQSPDWALGLALVDQSSNTPSSSEILLAGVVTINQPVHGHDVLADGQIKLDEYDSPIKGKEKSTWWLGR